MSRRRRMTVLLSLSLAAAMAVTGIAVSAVVSQGAAGAAVPSTVLSQVRRSVVWFGYPTANPKSFHVESTSIDAPAPDDFQITYADGNLTLVYQRAAGGPVTSQYSLTVLGLTEWNDTASNHQIEDGTLVAYTPLGPGAFGRYPFRHVETSTGDGVTLHTFLMTSNRGDLALNLTIANGFVTLPSGQILTPMEAKLSLDVTHNMTAPASLLALRLGMTTDQKVALENRSWDDLNDFSTDDHAVNVTNEAGGAPSSAFFAWSNTASVNGQVGPVTPSGPTVNATFGGYDLYLTYPRPASAAIQLEIVHDPTMGVVSAAYDSIVHPGPGSPLPFRSDLLVYAVSLAGIAALIAGTALLVSRRRRQR